MRYLLCLIYLMVTQSFATSLYDFNDPQKKARFHYYTHHLRCIVCQNQTLQESDAPLAIDLRNKLFEMINQNETNASIDAFLKERYGDFIFLKPPLINKTIALWIIPFLILGTFSILLFRFLKNSLR